MSKTSLAEPSTGEMMSAASSMYLYVESVFNCNNVFINMQDGKSAQQLQFDFNNHDDWEFVLYNTAIANYSPSGAVHTSPSVPVEDAATLPTTVATDANVSVVDDDVLEAPTSWVMSLAKSLPYARYLTRYPSGCKTWVYRQHIVVCDTTN